MIATRGPIQNDESRVNNRFGSGSMTKSPPWCIRRTSDSSPPLNGNSLNVIPAISTRASDAGFQRPQIRRKLLRQRQSQPSRIDRRRDAMHPRRATVRQRLGQQVREQQHLDAARFQHRGERVVLLLRLGDPRQPVEQQRVVVARGEPLQLGARAVQDDGAQPPDLGVARPAQRLSHLAP